MSTIPGIKASMNFDDYTDIEIITKADDLIEKCRLICDQIGEIKFEDVNYENLIQKLAEVESQFETGRSLIEILKSVSAKKNLRDAGVAAYQKIDEFRVEMSMRKDIFDRVVYFQEKNQLKIDDIKPEAKRYIERFIKLGKRAGLHLPLETQSQLKEIKTRLGELCIKFEHNLNEENTFLEFSESQLDGLPQDFIDNLEELGNGNRKVTLTYPHYFPVMRKCRVPETRRLLDKAFQSRCIVENTPILEEILKLRQKQADLLNYPNHAVYELEMTMAKTPENVSKFLTDLQQKVNPLWEKEKPIFLEFKRKECEELGIEFDNKLNMWDTRFYPSMVEEKLFALDHNKLKEYFPLNVVTKGLLEIYQELLGLKFELVTPDEKWHPDVQMYSVNDAETDELLGYFYLDLFPREGKYGHAACFNPQPGFLQTDGNRQLTVSAMVANLTKPTQDKPSLLDHRELETFFHEFGHVMHQICAKADFVLFFGTNVELDFVETPSQMLENWVWSKEPLKRMSAHYKDNTPLPDDMIKKLIQSQKANAGFYLLRQIVASIFDQKIHILPEANSAELFNNLYIEVTGISTIEDTNWPATFGHIVGGYDAHYYGYLWSEVFSCDMFASRFEKEGLMNSKVGKDYRRLILEPGGSKDADEMIRDFLGREPNENAFLKIKGIPT